MIGPLAYVGGKRRLASQIVRMLPTHVTYVEPFAGGAQVFFHKAPSRVEVLNDLDSEIVNLLRVCQHHHEELLRWLRWSVASREIFHIFSQQSPESLTDVQRAARFFYLQKNSFGGKVNGRGQNYHICVTKPTNYNPVRLLQLLGDVATRLARVQLECRSYHSVIKSYDRESTLFYCDPPYVGVKLYTNNLRDQEFHELAEHLGAIRGKFLLSINDHPVARAAFARFEMREVLVPYTLSQAVPKVKELLFANYGLPAVHLDTIAS